MKFLGYHSCMLLMFWLNLVHHQGVTAELNRLKMRFSWNIIDFVWPSSEARTKALQSQNYVPENIALLGIAAGSDRLVLTLPRWQPGVPVTLATIPRFSRHHSPLLTPYPNWDLQESNQCQGLTSVFRVYLDKCERLWVLDSGALDVGAGTANFTCPPSIFVFDFKTDKLLLKYQLPATVTKPDSLFTNIVVDMVDEHCDSEAYAYLTDNWRYALVVFSWKTHKSWRIQHEFFLPDPLAAKFTVKDLTFTFPDGLFSVALSPHDAMPASERILYFHSIASNRLFTVSTIPVRNASATKDDFDKYAMILPERGSEHQSTGSGMTSQGVLVFGMPPQNSVNCWNIRLPYMPSYLGIVDKDPDTLEYANDIRMDNLHNVWVLSNRLPHLLIQGLNRNETNFFILSATEDEVIRGSICDPGLH